MLEDVLTGFIARKRHIIRIKNKASMTILCHKTPRNIALVAKTFLLLIFFHVLLSQSTCLAQGEDWQVSYQSGIQSLQEDHLEESEKQLLKALRSAEENKLDSTKIDQALSLVYTARAIELERREEAKLDQSRNTFLYGIVILLLAGFIVSLLIRYGPERPKAVKDVESWMIKKKVDGTKDPTSQAAASIFSVLVFAFIALGLFLILMGFLFVLSMFSPPEDGHFEIANPYYDKAVVYLKKSEPDSIHLNRASALARYHEFLIREGKSGKALKLLKRKNLKKSKNSDKDSSGN